MKKVKGYLIGFGFIVLGVVIILFMFEHINKLYKNRIEITYTNEINENLKFLFCSKAILIFFCSFIKS